MHSVRPLVIVFALVTAFGTACSSSTGSPTAPSSVNGSTALVSENQLSGAWRLQSIQRAGQAAENVPAGADYSLTFADSRLAVRADCNACTGAYSLSGSTLSVANAVACTRAFCATAQFESVYTALLGGEHTVAITGNTLTWSSSRGTLTFAR